MSVDPPPDLVIEIDITSPSLNKLPIYAAVGVPEVWRFDGRRVIILTLVGDAYTEREDSVVVPHVTSSQLTDFLETSQRLPRVAWLRSVRDWAQNLRAGNG